VEGAFVTAVVIDGNAIAEQLRRSIADELQVLRLSEVRPGLATVLIGESFDAQAYEKHVKRLAESLDYRYVCERLPEDIELADVIATLGKLNADPRITGILVLHPLPPHIPEAEMNSAVDPLKDIEAVHPLNTGLLAQGRPRFLPSTPASCFYLLDHYADANGGGHESFYSGRTLVVVGRSNSVGKPAQMLGLQRNATVIACHSRTKPLEDYTRQADILIVAAGVRGIVDGTMVKEGVVAVDVGIHAVKDEETGKTRMVGDLDFESVSAKAEAITPVPGGVGPITDVWLVGNALMAAAIAHQVEPRFGLFR
jgi:methylenetetrahydrofolate dehydrogenase (NADP+) / methenyltetrahydrofolate cyclohydrolase